MAQAGSADGSGTGEETDAEAGASGVGPVDGIGGIGGMSVGGV